MHAGKRILTALLILSLFASLFSFPAFGDQTEGGENLTPETLPVRFFCDPAELILRVYRIDEDGGKLFYTAEEGVYFLLPGNYYYDAGCEGYLAKTAVPFTVSEDACRLTVSLARVEAAAVPDTDTEIIPDTEVIPDTEIIPATEVILDPEIIPATEIIAAPVQAPAEEVKNMGTSFGLTLTVTAMGETDITVNPGESTTLSVSISPENQEGLNIQWKRSCYDANDFTLHEEILEGENTASLTLNPVEKSGVYTCTVQDQSVSFQVRVNNSLSAQIEGGSVQYVTSGESITLRALVTAQDDSGIFYRWQKSGEEDAQITTRNEYSLSDITEDVTLFCDVMDAFGNLASAGGQEGTVSVLVDRSTKLTIGSERSDEIGDGRTYSFSATDTDYFLFSVERAGCGFRVAVTDVQTGSETVYTGQNSLTVKQYMLTGNSYRFSVQITDGDPTLPVKVAIRQAEDRACGNDLQWDFNAQSGELRISGSGEMWDYSRDERRLRTPGAAYAERITSLLLDEGVTGIGTYAFSLYPNLASVSLPPTLTRIGGGAFSGDGALAAIRLPESLQSIGWAAFEGTAISELSIPDTVTEMEYAAFLSCRSLRSVRLPERLSGIREQMFSGDTSLQEISIPNAVKTVNRSAFASCGELSLVRYDGTRSEWKQLTVEEGNDALQTARKQYRNDSLYDSIVNVLEWHGFSETDFVRCSVIACPVDVSVYREGQPVGQISGGVVSGESAGVRIITEEGTKLVLYADDAEYELLITATDSGTMDYRIQDMLGEKASKSFTGVALNAGKKLGSRLGGSVGTPNVLLYVLDSNDEIIKLVLTDGTEVSPAVSDAVITALSLQEGEEALTVDKAHPEDLLFSCTEAFSAQPFQIVRTTDQKVIATFISSQEMEPALFIREAGSEENQATVYGTEDFGRFFEISETNDGYTLRLKAALFEVLPVGDAFILHVFGPGETELSVPLHISDSGSVTDTPVSYIVTFDAGEYATVAPQTVVAGGLVSRPADPIASDRNYVFENWYREAACENLYNFATPVNGALTLYAKWVYHTHRFNTDGLCTVCGKSHYRIRLSNTIVVPEQLRDNPRLNTPELIKTALHDKAKEDFYQSYKTEPNEQNMTDREVIAEELIGENYVPLTPERFPAGGLRFTLPYPSGMGQKGYDFTVHHLKTDGTIERMSYSRTAEGLLVTATSLSPYTVSGAVQKLIGEPQITGKRTVGSTLTAALNLTNNTGVLHYQWKRDGVSIPGATAKTYIPVAADKGKTLSCVFTSSVQTGSITGNAGVICASNGSPPTGDESTVLLWTVLALLSAAACAGAGIRIRKTRKET